MLPHIFHLEFHRDQSLVRGGREGGRDGGTDGGREGRRREGGMQERFVICQCIIDMKQ